MTPEYNRVAAYYDLLARIVFGRRLERAKTAFLDLLQPHNRILIVGGGTGTLIEYIDSLGLPCHIDYVEISARMIQKAMKRQYEHITVDFYELDILRHQSKAEYNLVCTNFFFDQFNYPESERYLQYIKSCCHKEVIWLYADFVQPSSVKDRLLLSLMYAFFRLTTKLDKVQLIDHKTLFSSNGYMLKKSRNITSFIASEVYQIA